MQTPSAWPYARSRGAVEAAAQASSGQYDMNGLEFLGCAQDGLSGLRTGDMTGADHYRAISQMSGLGCGGSCSCAPCKAKAGMSGLGVLKAPSTKASVAVLLIVGLGAWLYLSDKRKLAAR